MSWDDMGRLDQLRNHKLTICVVSLQNSPLVGNFWFAFY